MLSDAEIKLLERPSFPICDCECHDPDVMVMHFVACCYTCDVCGARIKSSLYSTHAKVCFVKPSFETKEEDADCYKRLANLENFLIAKGYETVDKPLKGVDSKGYTTYEGEKAIYYHPLKDHMEYIYGKGAYDLHKDKIEARLNARKTP